MPRIDPHQLLTCLGVLLTPTGGILSKNEVQRLANLMTKFSKKLVSKCVYVLILKSTEVPLLGAFMTEGGWNLVHVWLQDGYNNKNWALVSELLDLLLMSPTDVEQLKMNNLPKLVKCLSKRDDLQNVKELASQLVQKWLKIVKGDQVEKLNQANADKMQIQAATTTVTVSDSIEVVPFVKVEQINEVSVKTEKQSNEETSVPTDDNNQSCYKLAVRDGKHILCKVPVNEANVTVVENAIIEDITPQQSKDIGNQEVPIKDATDRSEPEAELEESKEKKEIDKKKEKSNHDRNKSSSSSSSSSKSYSSRSREKDRSRDRSRDKGKSSSSSNKESSSKERSKDKSRRDKDKHRSNGSLKSSSSKSSSSKDKDKKETKEIQAEKDKDTLAKIQPPTLQKLGRIPKKNSEEKKDDKKDDSKKPTYSIEVRKNSEEKPKTVKVFNAKMRSTGLLEEAKPPPPRPVKKPATILPAIPAKRPSPVRDIIPPPEKKSKIEPAERPGAIKLIPPKPKPPVLQESDIFMDALAASASKKEPKKRKRRPSVSKEAQGSPPTSPSVATATSPTSSSMTFKNIAPAKFYQDTLETENEEEKVTSDDQEKTSEENINDNPPTPTNDNEKMDFDEPPQTESNGLKGVLVHTKRKGPKKSIRWKPDVDLVEIQYFELDETERVNVTKTFLDMAKMELSGEREALQMRKLQNDDVMDARTSWRMLIEMDLKHPLAEPGCKSLEKDIQFAREKTTVSFPAFIQGKYSESPAEPDHEIHQMTDPVSIPLDDPESAEQELPTQPWPEPKGSPPPVNVSNIPAIFPNIQAPFQNFNIGGPPPPFQNLPFSGPNFMPPNLIGGNNNAVNNEWNSMNMNNPQMMPPNNMPPHPEVIMNPGPPNNMFGPNHDNFNQNMNDNFTPYNQPNMGMFPQNNFNMRGGRGGFRRGGGNGPWVRMNGPGPGGWNQRGGGMNRGGRICKNVKIHGYCRNRDNCIFIHPN